MKTPSYYRHKPHEIERAFLLYVPEAPRVSPDVATDWEALSDDSGDGKVSNFFNCCYCFYFFTSKKKKQFLFTFVCICSPGLDLYFQKLDIKIPEMNGFGRHSNAESNENTSEAEMTEA